MLKMTSNKAAGEKKPEAYRLIHPPNPKPAEAGFFPMGTLRIVSSRECNFGKGRISVRLGLDGCNQVTFSIRL